MWDRIEENLNWMPVYIQNLVIGTVAGSLLVFAFCAGRLYERSGNRAGPTQAGSANPPNGPALRPPEFTRLVTGWEQACMNSSFAFSLISELVNIRSDTAPAIINGYEDLAFKCLSRSAPLPWKLQTRDGYIVGSTEEHLVQFFQLIRDASCENHQPAWEAASRMSLINGGPANTGWINPDCQESLARRHGIATTAP
ncbi:MAG: hypothetical protein M3O22_04225 [Pseudomonadota bacterium]|nr:hypothetical protein [Pseudomonadota bacterium]